jgi:hypothetical protein
MIHFCPSCGFDLSKVSDIKVEGPQNRSGEVDEAKNTSILDAYEPKETESGVEIAKPTKLDNNQRLIKLRNRPMPIIQAKRMDTEMDKFGDLVVGNGLTQED